MLNISVEVDRKNAKGGKTSFKFGLRITELAVIAALLFGPAHRTGKNTDPGRDRHDHQTLVQPDTYLTGRHHPHAQHATSHLHTPRASQAHYQPHPAA